MIEYKKGHCIFLGESRYIIKDLKDDKAFVVRISDLQGRDGKWILKSLLPLPFAEINLKE